jgi:hypothetical protein
MAARESPIRTAALATLRDVDRIKTAVGAGNHLRVDLLGLSILSHLAILALTMLSTLAILSHLAILALVILPLAMLMKWKPKPGFALALRLHIEMTLGTAQCLFTDTVRL